MSVDAVRFARSLVDDIEFSPEDASRTEPEFLAEVVSAIIEAGASTINIPDTVGYAVPDHFSWIISMLKQRVPNMDKAVISVHCHNDLGLAVANSLAAVKAGARQVECTINGLGERAGNCSLEEFVMALKVRSDHYNLKTRINTTRIFPTSRLVSSLTGISVQRNKAIVGENAFAHEAGIHQHGVMAEASTYEIMRPEDVGITSNKLVLGKHSGRHAFRERIEELGYHLDDAQIDKAFDQFKILSDKKKEIFDEDIEAIIEELATTEPFVWELVALQTTAGTSVMPTATVKLKIPKAKFCRTPPRATVRLTPYIRTIQRICGLTISLLNYQIRALTSGKEAQGEVNIEIQINGQPVRGRGVSTDIIEASAKAYITAINRHLARHKD